MINFGVFISFNFFTVKPIYVCIASSQNYSSIKLTKTMYKKTLNEK